ncbi:RPA1 [Enterospora canceri]|uniref:DNA-directed RNA polymerase subunit n=1 Tax=Enterospora canceri TaxID=1081671 RepID=A0A1Y1S727_9MICR|nr:RPA1 [Enterospora canceri]
MINNIKFLWYTKEEVVRLSEKEVKVAASLDKFGHPVPDGMYDLAMGPCDSDQVCKTCSLDCLQCPGHFGHIPIQPVINPLCYEMLFLILRASCSNCFKLKVSQNEKLNFYLELEQCETNLRTTKAETFQEFEEILVGGERRNGHCEEEHHSVALTWLRKASTRGRCPLCNGTNKKYKKGANMRILCDDPMDGLVTVGNRDVMKDVNATYANDKVIFDKLLKIGDDEKGGIGFLFLEVLPVTPNKFRPIKKRDGFVFENATNAQLNSILTASLLSERDEKYSAELQSLVSLYFDSARDQKQQGIKQLLEKKEGLFRQNIMGKRVNYSARSVISPDPWIGTGEIGVPLVFANQLTFPERVNSTNLKKMQELVTGGPCAYPGANFVLEKTDSQQKLLSLKVLSKSRRRQIAARFATSRCEFTVYRHLVTGDRVLVNRQPSLHKMSMMGHRVRVLKNEKTLRMHYVNCKPYNADFDGDEMNIHFPQSHAAQAEIEEVCLTDFNFLVPSTNEPIRGLTQDHLVVAAVMTSKNEIYDRDEYHHIVHSALYEEVDGPLVFVDPFLTVSDGESRRVFYSGLNVVSTVLVNVTKGLPTSLTHRFKSKITGETVIFRESEMLTGLLDKNTLGTAVNSLIHVCGKLFGYKICNRLLTIFGRMVNGYMALRGFTLGHDDLLLDEEGEKRLQNELLVRNRRSRVESENKSNIQVLLRETNGALSGLQGLLASSMQKSFLGNNILAMVQSGAKGSMVNVSQISICLGQQELEGKRVPAQASGKSLACFEADEYFTSPAAGGFVYERFLTGLSPGSFYFHCMAGREGLIDTAVKTANSGYLQRCLVKHLEGTTICYDGTVRNHRRIVQFEYDGDADPGASVGVLAAQSIGEPSTQMTLNTFHLAGVAGKNMTLGIPRLREIVMVASKNIKTPIIKMAVDEKMGMKLEQVFRRVTASDCVGQLWAEEQFVKERNAVADGFVKRVVVTFRILDEEGAVVHAIDNLFVSKLNRMIKVKSTSCGIEMNEQDEQVHETKKEENSDDESTDVDDTTVDGETETNKTPLSESGDSDSSESEHSHGSSNLIHLRMTKSGLYSLEINFQPTMTQNILPLAEAVLSKIVIREIPGFAGGKMDTTRPNHPGPATFYLDGSNFTTLFNITLISNNPDVFYNSYSNDIHSICGHFGIEAARNVIVAEIESVFDVYGIRIETRHLDLVADYLTRDGLYQAFNRQSFDMDDSILQRMSFESCFERVKDASLFRLSDNMNNPSANICVGNMIHNGTGCFDLLYDLDI